MSRLVSFPPYPIHSERTYRLRSRPLKTFGTVLDSKKFIDPKGDHRALVRIDSRLDAERNAHVVEIYCQHFIIGGRIAETLTLQQVGDRLESTALLRRVLNYEEREVRLEEVDFRDATLPLPEACYPEVMLPFLLSWQPFDGKVRDLYAWMNDRFVARVQYETVRKTELHLPSGSRQAIEGIMYPDFNDWVNLGRALSRLVKPFLPKYRMWFAPEPPHEVLRFEGPYGPPGAPEIIIELL